MRILLLLTLLLNGCSSFPGPKPELVYQDSASGSVPNAVIETALCSNDLMLEVVSLSIWRVSDNNQHEMVYQSEHTHKCPVVELQPGIYFIAFDVYRYKRGSRRGYGKVVINAGHRYIFHYDIYRYWWTVWLENVETGEVVLGSKIPY